AAFTDHMEEARGAEPRMSSKDLLDESLVWVEDRRDDTRLDRADHVVVEDRPPDRVVVEAELRRDRADLPLLGVVEPPDLSALVRGDHGASQSWGSRLPSTSLSS